MTGTDPTPGDWRLTNQRGYLEGVTLTRAEWTPSRPEWDHDHCAFCFAKFGQGGDQLIGYATDDRYHWVCEACCSDFAESFDWTLD